MHKGILLAVGLAALSGSGCVNTENYAAAGEAMKGSPQLRETAIADCVVETSRMPIDQKREVAKWMRVPTSKMTSIFCRRIVTALGNGKLTYGDYRKLSAGQPTKRAVDVIMGRV